MNSNTLAAVIWICLTLIALSVQTCTIIHYDHPTVQGEALGGDE